MGLCEQQPSRGFLSPPGLAWVTSCYPPKQEVSMWVFQLLCADILAHPHSYCCKPLVGGVKIANEGEKQLVGEKKHKPDMKLRWFQGTLPCSGQGIAQQIAEIFRDSWSPFSDGCNLSSEVLNCINSKHYNPLLPFAAFYLLKHVTTPGAEVSNAYNFQQTWLLDISSQRHSPKLWWCYTHIYSLLLLPSSPPTLGNTDEHLHWNTNAVKFSGSKPIAYGTKHSISDGCCQSRVTVDIHLMLTYWERATSKSSSKKETNTDDVCIGGDRHHVRVLLMYNMHYVHYA